MSKSFHTTAIFLLSFSAPILSALSGVALADDFTVSAPSTDTNGGHVIDGYDTVTVTKDGSIDTSTAFQHAINSTGGNNTIVMDGSITTTGGEAVGIYNDASDNSSLTNNGIILTSGGNFSTGIYNKMSHITFVTNNGTIQTRDDFNSGIENESSIGSPVANNGIIETEGDFSYGIMNFLAKNRRSRTRAPSKQPVNWPLALPTSFQQAH